MPGRTTRTASSTPAISTAAPAVVARRPIESAILPWMTAPERVERPEDHVVHREHPAAEVRRARAAATIVKKLDSAPRYSAPTKKSATRRDGSAGAYA